MNAPHTVALVAIVVLAVLHQDFWLWSDDSLWFGFLPAGLAYHGAFSLIAALTWYVVLRIAWPADPFAGEDAP